MPVTSSPEFSFDFFIELAFVFAVLLHNFLNSLPSNFAIFVLFSLLVLTEATPLALPAKPPSNYSLPMAPSDNYQATISQLLKKVACDKPLLKLLANSYDPASRDQFTKALYNLLPAEAESVLKDPWNACMTYCM